MTDARDGPLGIRKHQCEHCPKSFKRREHWQRHSRSHTHEKPFECRFCQKCFARRDLVTRHEKTLHANDGSPNGSPTSARGESMKAARTDLSPTSVIFGGQNVASPSADEPWDGYPGLLSFAAAVSPTQPSSGVNDSLKYHVSSAVDRFEDFLDPALRVHSDDGGLWDWTFRQTPQDANAYTGSQVLETPAISTNVAATVGNADKTSILAIPDVVIENLLTHAFGSSVVNDTPPPSTDLVRMCLAAYFESFNIHLPVIHQPSFDYAREPPQLLLAMAAIGALYRLERKVATYLYLAAEARLPDDNFCDQTCADLFYAGDLASPDEAVDEVQTVKLADARTLVLLMLFGAFSGNRDVSEKAIGRQGRLANAYHSIARNVQHETLSPAPSIYWQGWVQLESKRRLLHGVWILCNLLTATYGIPPGVSVPLHGDVQLPCPDALWQAATAAEWQALSDTTETFLTIKAAVDLLCSEGESTLANLTPDSGFGITLLTHAFSVHVWHSANSFGASGSRSIREGLSTSQRMLAEHCAPTLTGSIEPRPNFLFNASAITRIAYSRSSSGPGTTDRSAMLRGDTAARLAATRHYIQEPFPRTHVTLAAVTNILENFVFHNQGGTLLIRRTAGLAWSFEHMVSAWDSALLLIKWLHETGFDTEANEQALRDRIATTLRRESCEINSQTSMAAALARFFSLFCEEWVWGVTARMGTAYRSIADFLEEAHRDS